MPGSLQARKGEVAVKMGSMEARWTVGPSASVQAATPPSRKLGLGLPNYEQCSGLILDGFPLSDEQLTAFEGEACLGKNSSLHSLSDQICLGISSILGYRHGVPARGFAPAPNRAGNVIGSGGRQGGQDQEEDRELREGERRALAAPAL